MTTITEEQEASIRDRIMGQEHIPVGLGSKDEACSVAAINLALSGELTDEVPDCMSPVVGRWIIRVQDAMPASLRDSVEWRSLLPLAAGTGRDHEDERRAIVMDWMWGVVLPSIQVVADRHGFGKVWAVMCKERTAYAARAAAYAARAAAYADAYAAAYAARAAAYADAYAAADAASAAAYAASAAAYAAGKERLWTLYDPVAVLRRLVAVTDPRSTVDGGC